MKNIRKTNNYVALRLLVVVLLGGGLLLSCGGNQPRDLEANYSASIEAARHPTADRVSQSLLPITASTPGLEWDSVTLADGSTARMVPACVMLDSSRLSQWAATDTFRLAKELGAWITMKADWLRHREAFEGLDSAAARLRMVEMLGLPPDCDYDLVVEVYVDTAGVFRPAMDPTITTTTAPAEFPAWVDDKFTVCGYNYREWFRYQVTMAYEDDSPCPWSQLGYTVDWHDGTAAEGLSEYIGAFGALARVKKRMGAWQFVQSLRNQ